ncbi:putative universal stress protein SAUSA300_1656 [Ylistrum balloti]|uniref:putative universal stress protein SAUSA300_1656 n=1 Tax=Ylistrum balloti TaxID=509963 RepID=UPI002905CAE7|nr:putative universal stress protein SAUSA300_1656 [Ylistrum balloti]
MEDTVNVLIAMDGSEHAKFAFNYYMEQIHSPKFNIVMVHVVGSPESLHKTEWYKAHDSDTIHKILEEEKAKLKETLEGYGQLLKDAEVDGTVQSIHAAQPGRGIIQAAEECNAQMIVTGCRGIGKVRRTLMGSVSDYVVHHATVPTLVCRHPREHHGHEHHK